MIRYLSMRFRCTYHLLLLIIGISSGLLAIANKSVIAQTCSCAGAPLLSSQDVAGIGTNQLMMSATYEYHDISDLVSGSEEVTNNIFNRYTHSLLIEGNYGVTRRLMVTGLVSMVQKELVTTRNVRSRGVGDAMVMGKYILHPNTFDEQYQISVGAGVKMPLNSNNLKSSEGIQLQPSMQPGSGSWDGILWGYASKTFLPATTLNLFLTSSYRLRGGYEPFENSDQTFRFGNEWVTKLGGGIQLIEGLKPSLRLKHRYQGKDVIEGSKVNDTGGHWVNVIPGINYQLTNQWAVRVAGELPLYRQLNGGLQYSTRYALKTTLFYNLNL